MEESKCGEESNSPFWEKLFGILKLLHNFETITSGIPAVIASALGFDDKDVCLASLHALSDELYSTRNSFSPVGQVLSGQDKIDFHDACYAILNGILLGRDDESMGTAADDDDVDE